MIAFRGLHQQLRPYADAAMQLAQQYKISPTVTSVTRSLELQAKLRANWERCVAEGHYPSSKSYGPGLSCKWPANRPGDSGHNYGLAWDSWVPPEQMALWTAIRRHIGWDVPEHDQIHAELPNWRQYVK